MANRHGAANRRILSGLASLLQRLLRAQPVDAFYQPDLMDEWLRIAIEQDRAARQAAAREMDAYLDRVTDVETDGWLDLPDVDDLDVTDIRGVPDEDVWQRPLAEFRVSRAGGDSIDDARDKAASRVEVIADGNVNLASRLAAAPKLDAPHVRGYRRIVHPELARGGSCGKCVAAADHLYHSGDLLPVHGGCNCTIMPVIAGYADPKALWDATDYRQALSLAQSTAGGDLRRVTITVVEHGELGPVLEYAHGSARVTVTPQMVGAAEASRQYEDARRLVEAIATAA